MTPAEYKSIRDTIEAKYHEDMAALERIWVLTNGCNAPESPVDLESNGLRSAEALGIPAANRIEDMHRKRNTLRDDNKAILDAKERRRKYMRKWYLDHKAKK